MENNSRSELAGSFGVAERVLPPGVEWMLIGLGLLDLARGDAGEASLPLRTVGLAGGDGEPGTSYKRVSAAS